jgi:uncharacterized membrane protein HdeD (DUF308 family)
MSRRRDGSYFRDLTVNLRLLRLVGILLGDAGIVLATLTFFVRLDSIVRLFAVILIVAGVVALFRWTALKGEVGKNDGAGSLSAVAPS